MVKALAVDLSSNNARPNLRAHFDAGYRVLVLKATEGTGYKWTDGNALHREWHSLGPDTSVWRYAFLRPGSGVDQGDAFVSATSGLWRAGDRPVADCEVAGVTATLVRAFVNRVHRAIGPRTLPGLIYGSPYFLRDARIVSAHGWLLWLADYASRIAFVPPGFDGKVAAWQYTDRRTGVPGVPGAVDCSTLHPSVMPAEHQHKRVETPLAHRREARLVLGGLQARHLPVKAGHGDRVLLAELAHEARRALSIEPPKGPHK